MNCCHGLDEDETLRALGGERVRFNITRCPHGQVSISVAQRAHVAQTDFLGSAHVSDAKVEYFYKSNFRIFLSSPFNGGNSC